VECVVFFLLWGVVVCFCFFFGVFVFCLRLGLCVCGFFFFFFFFLKRFVFYAVEVSPASRFGWIS